MGSSRMSGRKKRKLKSNPRRVWLKAGDQFGNWKLKKRLGKGGNGEVWEVSQSGRPPHAIKVLNSMDPESYSRFKNEINFLSTLGNLDGVVPLVDKHIPSSSRKHRPWYVMPLAEPAVKHFWKRKPTKLVADFVSAGKALAALHEKHVSHRDIKPANLLYLNGALCLSDFGLVKFPHREAITPKRRDVGAKFTMAPEMRRYASEAEGEPADVYSFAKSLWIALTHKELGFDGQYHPDAQALSLKSFLSGLYTTALDELLRECTDNDPARRPAMPEVVARLNDWLDLIGDFDRRNPTEWNELIAKLFPIAPPTRAEWTQLDEICLVLSEVIAIPALSHMFYPNKGGNHLDGVSRGNEADTLMLHVKFGSHEILKPAKLTYESFGHDSQWNYFRLEAASLEPSGVEGAVSSTGEYEPLTELFPGQYDSYQCWEDQQLNGKPLPRRARPVTRFLKGSFVFFSTRSIYNQTPATYDARHNKMTEENFRSYIRGLAEASARS